MKMRFLRGKTGSGTEGQEGARVLEQGYPPAQRSTDCRLRFANHGLLVRPARSVFDREDFDVVAHGVRWSLAGGHCRAP